MFYNYSGKIWCFVNNYFNAIIRSDNEQQISLFVKDQSMGLDFMLILVYMLNVINMNDWNFGIVYLPLLIEFQVNVYWEVIFIHLNASDNTSRVPVVAENV